MLYIVATTSFDNPEYLDVYAIEAKSNLEAKKKFILKELEESTIVRAAKAWSAAVDITKSEKNIIEKMFEMLTTPEDTIYKLFKLNIKTGKAKEIE